MTKALRKNTRRSISGSLGRYIAILLIIMLGVAFLTGLRDTRPIMSATETAYVKNTKLYDLRLISTMALMRTTLPPCRKPTVWLPPQAV